MALVEHFDPLALPPFRWRCSSIISPTVDAGRDPARYPTLDRQDAIAVLELARELLLEDAA
jgi:hypothetical protein